VSGFLAGGGSPSVDAGRFDPESMGMHDANSSSTKNTRKICVRRRVLRVIAGKARLKAEKVPRRRRSWSYGIEKG